MRIGLSEQVFRFMNLVGGVHGHQHRADLGRSPEGQEPLGHIRRPDRDLGACAHAQGNQGACKLVHVLAELAVGPGVIERGKLDRQLVREFLHHGVQYLRKGLVDQFALFPDVIAGVRLIPPQMLAAEPRAFKPAHAAGEMREDDFNILKPFDPARIPLQGNEMVIVDGPERIHEITDGQLALAQEFRRDHAVHEPIVMNVHMAGVCTEVRDRLLRALACKAGSGHIPACAQSVVRIAVQKISQAKRICVRADSIDQKTDRLLSDHVQQFAQCFLTGRLIMFSRMNHNVFRAQIHGHFHGLCKLGCKGRTGKVGDRPHAGNRKPLMHQLTARDGRKLRIRRTGLAAEHL